MNFGYSVTTDDDENQTMHGSIVLTLAKTNLINDIDMYFGIMFRDYPSTDSTAWDGVRCKVNYNYDEINDDDVDIVYYVTDHWQVLSDKIKYLGADDDELAPDAVNNYVKKADTSSTKYRSATDTIEFRCDWSRAFATGDDQDYEFSVEDNEIFEFNGFYYAYEEDEDDSVNIYGEETIQVVLESAINSFRNNSNVLVA
eukprot:CAMPEP_0116884738 /NCGR_PEP_ID=MMETSP0463-20121206/17750_1 /TAXON_ID=181622 /ORGANISM="Strombidinopsis sp, Strain SopsisLIS2011" /LENGTH=198 /DNA_ID=CAMNT_0004541783 /DNA_START=39 /DNA_END=631 /DNA_ORIENTATION=-